MEYQQAAALVDEKLGEWADKDAWALYCTPEQCQEIQDDVQAVVNDPNGPVKGVEIRVDPDIVEPQVLPKNVEDFPPEMGILEDPPRELVEQIINPEMNEYDISGGGRTRAVFTYSPRYEVNQVEYRLDLSALCKLGQHGVTPTVANQIVSCASGERWESRLEENELVLTRTPKGDSEYTRQRIAFSYDHNSLYEDREKVLDMIGVEEQMAETAIGQIRGTVREPINDRIEVLADDEPQHVEMVEDKEDLLKDVSQEIESYEEEIGERIISLGRLYVRPDPDE